MKIHKWFIVRLKQFRGIVARHERRSVLDRYRIMSPEDLQEAARKLAGALSDTPTKNNQGVAFATP